MADKMNLIPEKDYIATCDFIRETDGSSAPILSGELAGRVEDIVSFVLEKQYGNAPFLGSNKIVDLRNGALMDVNVDRISFPNLSPVGVGIRCFEGARIRRIEYDDLPTVVFGNTRWMASCPNLTYAIFPSLKRLGTEGFSGCTRLETLILDRNEVVTYDAGALDNTLIIKGSGYVYVPKALVEQYKTTPVWRDIAAQIRAIEDYPDIVNPPTV